MGCLRLFAILAMVLSPQIAKAISITGTSDPSALEAGLLGLVPGLTVTGFSVSNQTGAGGEVSTGVYTNASGTYGIPRGVVLSSGDVRDYADGPNTAPNFTFDYAAPATAAQEALLDPITGGGFNHFDTTQLNVTFDVDLTVTEVFFNVVFGSEEFPEFVGSSFIDGFGIYFNGTNIAFAGGLPININHPDFGPLPGTELDGILAPGGISRLRFDVPVTPGSTSNTLVFILGDSSDGAFDTTVYVNGLGSQIPEPATALMVSLGLVLLAGPQARRRRRTSRNRP